MKYFNITENSSQEQSGDWKENLENYWKTFDKIKKRLPRAFCNAYCKTAFHDFLLISIKSGKNYKNKNDSYYTEIILNYDSDYYSLRYNGVTKLIQEFHKNDNEQNNVYLYGEFLAVSETKLSHEIYLGTKKKIYIEFERLEYSHYRIQ